jgi:hypothetical protein
MTRAAATTNSGRKATEIRLIQFSLSICFLD